MSQQEFWQDVAFEHDRKYERTRGSAVAARLKKKQVVAEAAEVDDDEYDDVFFGMDGDDDTLHFPGEGDSSAAGDGGADARDARQRNSEISEAMCSDPSLASSRRAELMGLLEDLGEDALLPRPVQPWEATDVGQEARSDQALIKEAQQRQLLISNAFIDSIKIREPALEKDGAYFSYLLHTRRVAKVGAEGKRVSHSVLVVVGNGKGTAGLGLGKDVEAGTALYKATQAAKRSLVHIDRFDGRTLFHPMDEFYAKTKLVLRLRRAGSGTRCSWPVWKIFSAFGITDVSCKIHGSRNVLNVANALVNALQRMTTAQKVADRRSVRILDMTPRTPGGKRGFEVE